MAGLIFSACYHCDHLQEHFKEKNGMKEHDVEHSSITLSIYIPIRGAVVVVALSSRSSMISGQIPSATYCLYGESNVLTVSTWVPLDSLVFSHYLKDMQVGILAALNWS